MCIHTCFDCSEANYTLVSINIFGSYHTNFETCNYLFLVLCILFLLCMCCFSKGFWVSRFMKLIKTKKVVSRRFGRRSKESPYGMINNIFEALASIEFWLLFNKSHVWSCFQCDDFFLKVILFKLIYEYIDR